MLVTSSSGPGYETVAAPVILLSTYTEKTKKESLLSSIEIITLVLQKKLN